MSNRTRTKRATQEEVAARVDELLSLQTKLSAVGEELTLEMIMERLSISRRQAHRYMNKLEAMRSRSLEPDMGIELVHSLLKKLPQINEILSQDLNRLDEMEGESDSESLSLIKARRDQALAIARLGSQFLKELRDLGFLKKNSDEQSNSSDPDNTKTPMSEELQAEVLEAANRELLEFEEQLKADEVST